MALMIPSTSREELQSRIDAAGFSLTTLPLHEGVRLMVEFYQQIRAEGCDLPPERDMLLYQWGTPDWGQGRYFEIDLTRQFVSAGDDPDDDTMSQLHLTFSYDPTPVFNDLKSGNHWCEAPSGVAEFSSFILSSPAFMATSSIKFFRVALSYDLT